MIDTTTIDPAIPPVIASLRFDQLGCHWLDPRRDHLHPAEIDQRPRCYELLARFVEVYDVHPFKFTHRNLHALFRQGGATAAAVKEVLVNCFQASAGMLGDVCGKGCPFDHAELWGRDGTPLILVGHPYEVSGEAWYTIAAIAGLGLDVTIRSEGWYGFGTREIQVSCHGPSPAVVSSTSSLEPSVPRGDK